MDYIPFNIQRDRGYSLTVLNRGLNYYARVKSRFVPITLELKVNRSRRSHGSVQLQSAVNESDFRRSEFG